MNNEPVAWLVQYKDRHEFRWSKPEYLFEALACEPLYTHPADESFDRTASHTAGEYVSYPAKTLTDGEIVRISETCDLNHVLGLIDFGREILKKASEK